MDILLQEIMLSIKAILGVIKSSTGQRRHGIVADSVTSAGSFSNTSRIIWAHLKNLDKITTKKKIAQKFIYPIQNNDNFFILLRFI